MKTMTALLAAALLVTAAATATEADPRAEAIARALRRVDAAETAFRSAPPAAIAESMQQLCRHAPRDYRVWLTAGDEYIEVKHPRIEAGQLVYQRFGGEVRRDAAEVVKIEPVPPDTADQAYLAMVQSLQQHFGRRPSQLHKVFEAVDRWDCAVVRDVLR
jgi:hypothetical protein